MSYNGAFGRHEFDLLQIPKHCRIDLTRASSDDLDEITKLAAQEIPGDLAGSDVVRRVTVHNPNNLLVFKRGTGVVGGWSMLMLSPVGLEDLFLGNLDTGSPNPRQLTSSTQAPAAIYVWAVVAPGLAAEGIRHVAKFLRQPLYAAANLYSRPNTELGIALNVSLGFRPVTAVGGGLYRYVRLANRPDADRPTAH